MTYLLHVCEEEIHQVTETEKHVGSSACGQLRKKHVERPSLLCKRDIRPLINILPYLYWIYDEEKFKS